jgi:hypothetical protein
MAQTAAGLSSIAYEVYTGDQLEKQFYEEAPILERFERTNKYTMGREVRVPIWSYNGNGTTVLPAGGGTFNPDDAQDTQVARFTLSYAWQPIGLEFGALNEVHGSPSAAADALTLEVEGAVIGLRRQVMRMAGGGGDGLIAGTLAGGPSTTINLDPAKRGSHAVAAGFLTPGITVDIGTSPNGQSLATARLITDVIESDTAPQIVVSGANITTTGAEFVTLAHPAGAPTEFTGLRSIAGSATSIVGLVDPTLAGKRFYQPAFVDTTTTVYSLDLPLQAAAQGPRQDPQDPDVVRLLAHAGRQPLQPAADAGALRRRHEPHRRRRPEGRLERHGVHRRPGHPGRELYLLDPESFFVAVGKYSKPTWKSDIQGVNTRPGLGDRRVRVQGRARVRALARRQAPQHHRQRPGAHLAARPIPRRRSPLGRPQGARPPAGGEPVTPNAKEP